MLLVPSTFFPLLCFSFEKDALNSIQWTHMTFQIKENKFFLKKFSFYVRRI